MDEKFSCINPFACSTLNTRRAEMANPNLPCLKITWKFKFSFQYLILEQPPGRLWGGLDFRGVQSVEHTWLTVAGMKKNPFVPSALKHTKEAHQIVFKPYQVA